MALLVVQRGHVPRTTGATGAPGEQAFAIAAARRVEVHVRALGHAVRTIDADPSRRDEYRGDFFVALHCDSSSSFTARGASIGHRTTPGADFGRAWKRHYVANGWAGGFRPDNYTDNLAGYYGVRAAVAQGTVAAFIAECGFLSNPDDAALLAGHAGPDRVGRAIAAAMVDMTGCRCPSTTAPPALEPPTPAYPGMVRRGARGGAVSAWQAQLNARGARLVVDGVFGRRTEIALQDWQRRHGLVVDGIAGPATWHSLLFSDR